MSRKEVESALSFVPSWPRTKLGIGVLMSQKTLCGEPNKWPGRFPKREVVAGIFADNPNVLNLIHYSTDNLRYLFAQLCDVLRWAGPNCHGFQLNVPWPPMPQLEDFASLRPGKVIILQIGSAALAQIETPKELAMRIGEYVHVIDGVLIDRSAGLGKPLDVEECAGYFRAIRERYPDLGIGGAGGLGSPESIHEIMPLMREFPGMNIDAEKNLRTVPEDDLDLHKTRLYLRESFGIFP